MSEKLEFTRRRALQASGAATVALWAAAGGTARAEAVAASAPPHLRRSAYEALAEPRALSVAGEGRTLRLTSVGDLLGARDDAALRGSDDAFALVLEETTAADAPLAQGIHALAHPDLGRFELFLAPAEDPSGAARGLRYAVVVDRSRDRPRRPPEQDEPSEAVGAPATASTGDPAAPASASSDGAAPGDRPVDAPAAPALLDAALTRGEAGGAVVALRFASGDDDAGAVAQVDVALVRGGSDVARASGRPLDDGTLRVGLTGPDRRVPVAAGPGELRVTVVGADGEAREERRSATLR